MWIFIERLFVNVFVPFYLVDFQIGIVQGDTANTLILLSFQSLGTVLRDIIVDQNSLWVISEALDAIFDTFADGPLVNTAADSIGLLMNLQQLVPVLKSRVRSIVIGRFEPDTNVREGQACDWCVVFYRLKIGEDTYF